MPELTPLDDNRQEHFLNGEDLEPITRREHFYAGRESELPAGHQEPETREEWFIQKYRGGGGDVTVVPLSVTENGTYSEEGKAYSPVSVNVPLPENAYLLKSVSNLPQPIASFSDGEDMVMPSLKVAIEPQQDLHGYDSPWVGGAGKNKLPLTVDNIKTLNGGANSWTDNTKVINGITYTILTDGNGNVTGINMNGTANSTSMLFLYNSNNIYNDMKVNGCPNGSDYSTYSLCFALMQSPWTTLGVVDSASERTITIANDVPVACYLNVENGKSVSNKVAYPMIRLASVQDDTFEPYSNICPISGFTEANVGVSGKNLFGGTYDNIYSLYISKGTQITLSTKAPQVPYSRFAIYDKDQNMIDYWAINNVDSETGRYYRTFTFSVDVYYVKYYYSPCEEMQIKFGTDVTYEPYNGQTYTIDLDGTRYGGTLDVVSGVLTVDWAMLDLGNLNYTKNATYPNIFNTTLAINAKNTLDAICEIYTLYDSETLSQYDYGFAISARLSVMYIKNKDYAEIDDFKTAMNGVKVVYKLATPITYQLTPTQVKSLLGSNNVWADTGDITDAEYFSKEV